MNLEELNNYTGDVVFSASYCGPCQTLKSNLDKKQIVANIIVVDEHPQGAEIAETFKIKSVPVCLELQEGSEFFRYTGAAEIFNYLVDKSQKSE